MAYTPFLAPTLLRRKGMHLPQFGHLHAIRRVRQTASEWPAAARTSFRARVTGSCRSVAGVAVVVEQRRERLGRQTAVIPEKPVPPDLAGRAAGTPACGPGAASCRAGAARRRCGKRRAHAMTHVLRSTQGSLYRPFEAVCLERRDRPCQVIALALPAQLAAEHGGLVAETVLDPHAKHARLAKLSHFQG